jgi:hypothetical protein
MGREGASEKGTTTFTILLPPPLLFLRDSPSLVRHRRRAAAATCATKITSINDFYKLFLYKFPANTCFLFYHSKNLVRTFKNKTKIEMKSKAYYGHRGMKDGRSYEEPSSAAAAAMPSWPPPPLEQCGILARSLCRIGASCVRATACRDLVGGEGNAGSKATTAPPLATFTVSLFFRWPGEAAFLAIRMPPRRA